MTTKFKCGYTQYFDEFEKILKSNTAIRNCCSNIEYSVGKSIGKGSPHMSQLYDSYKFNKMRTIDNYL